MSLRNPSKTTFLATCLALAVTAGACTRTLEARPAPADVVPRVAPRGPAADGTTRVVLDAVGDDGAPAHAKVVEVLGRSSVSGYNVYGVVEHVRPVCTAPCIADLAPGAHVLRYLHADGTASTEDVELDVELNPLLVRHRLGYVRQGGAVRQIGTISATLGILGTLGTGIWYLSDDGGRSTSGPALGASIGLVGLGILLIVLDPATYQPSTTAIYPLKAEPEPRPTAAF